MLDFFRRYQRYFFIVITIMIIMSFSFFGTYSTLGSNTWREQVAFKAVNGREVTRSDVDEMALFLGTDSDDKVLYGGVWGQNFLNDGVIRKDFLDTGLAQELALAYATDLQEDIDKRLQKEKKYVPYTHPQARFLNVQGIWSYFAPEMNTNFDALRVAQNGLDLDAFNNRVKLYLGEKKVSPATLRYVIRLQEKQYNWLQPDEKLNQTDLSLFGYHSFEDWFGPHFTRLISEFIINAAILAEERGYDVSRAEALTDLLRNTQISYQQNLDNPYLGVTSPEEYFSEQLRRLNMDQARAIKVWRQILLFRRYFHDAGATALVDNITSQSLQQFAHQNVNLDLYQLPEALKLANFDDLQKLETYVKAVAKNDKSDPLALPQQFLTVKEVSKTYAELVKKQYELEVAQVSQKTLQARIGLREMWNWQLNDEHWQQLTKQFPTLAAKDAKSREERMEALDELDPTTHSLANTFAKQAIVKEHPEWIDQALDAAKPETMDVGLREKGGNMPFSGFAKKENRKSFIQLLDQATIGEAPKSDSPLYHFSDDNQSFYRITVLSRAFEPEILTFEEARSDGTLNDVRDRQLEKYYSATREQNPLPYQKENNEWKSFASVKELVANQYFEKTLAALEKSQKELSSSDKKTVSPDEAASLRFYPHMKQIKTALEKDPTSASQWIKSEENETPASLADQWKIEKKTIEFDRQKGQERMDLEEAYELSPQAWSSLKTPPDGSLAFYQVKNHGITPLEPKVIAEQTRAAQLLLGAEAQRHLMKQVLQELKSKNALSLAYLSIPRDEAPSDQQESME